MDEKNYEKKDCRVVYYGRYVFESIEEYLETKDIETILSMYTDEKVKEQIRSFMASKKNQAYVEKFPRIYPFYDCSRILRNLYFRYWPTKEEVRNKFKEITDLEMQTIVTPLRLLDREEYKNIT